MDADFIQQSLVGNSPVFLEAVRLIRKIAACDATVLIQGETGTGKELAARAIHYLGSRKNAPFVAVNCGAIPESLIESELFGHARGAFTDAREARAGLVTQARGGTLFLDEVESLSPRGQVALLRFLQDGEYRPLGGPVVRDANVRSIASTNVDLATVASRGTYRTDFLFRLCVLVLDLPPLRSRDGDALLIAEYFIRRFSAQYGIPPRLLGQEAREYILRHEWPGNVRELENLIHRELLLGERSDMSIGQLPAPRSAAPKGETVGITDLQFRQAKARAISEFERAYITELLQRTQGNVSQAARLSGKERSRLGKLVKKYGLNRVAFRYSAGDSPPPVALPSGALPTRLGLGRPTARPGP
jgi:DNA-binding NtrC family response regulator